MFDRVKFPGDKQYSIRRTIDNPGIAVSIGENTFYFHPPGMKHFDFFTMPGRHYGVVRPGARGVIVRVGTYVFCFYL